MAGQQDRLAPWTEWRVLDGATSSGRTYYYLARVTADGEVTQHWMAKMRYEVRRWYSRGPAETMAATLNAMQVETRFRPQAESPIAAAAAILRAAAEADRAIKARLPADACRECNGVGHWGGVESQRLTVCDVCAGTGKSSPQIQHASQQGGS